MAGPITLPSESKVEETPDGVRYTLPRKTGKDQGMFETSVTTYTDAKGRKLTLIAAVHIADSEHYAELQREFKTYDGLLYELVARPTDRPYPGGRPRGGLSFIQRAMAVAVTSMTASATPASQGSHATDVANSAANGARSAHATKAAPNVIWSAEQPALA